MPNRSAVKYKVMGQTFSLFLRISIETPHTIPEYLCLSLILVPILVVVVFSSF